MRRGLEAARQNLAGWAKSQEGGAPRAELED